MQTSDNGPLASNPLEELWAYVCRESRRFPLKVKTTPYGNLKCWCRGKWVDNMPKDGCTLARDWNHDLLIISTTPYHCTTTPSIHIFRDRKRPQLPYVLQPIDNKRKEVSIRPTFRGIVRWPWSHSSWTRSDSFCFPLRHHLDLIIVQASFVHLMKQNSTMTHGGRQMEVFLSHGWLSSMSNSMAYHQSMVWW